MVFFVETFCDEDFRVVLWKLLKKMLTFVRIQECPGSDI